MRKRFLLRRHLPVVVITALLLALVLPYTASAGNGWISAGEARNVALKLMGSVSRETAANPGGPGAEPGWKGAIAGVPLLINNMEGVPSEYIVPVVSSGGRTISVIGVGAGDATWHWYAEYPHNIFPLIDIDKAGSLVNEYLAKRGVSAEAGLPQARIAPDKTVYWTFQLNTDGAVNTVYLPAFMEGRPCTNLEPPWKQARTFNPAELPAGPGSGAPSVPASPAGVTGGAPAAYDIADVPYHQQETSFWCGPASLEMIFDYFGPDIAQGEIASVANASSAYGCYADDLWRAGHFSNQSTSVQDGSLRGYSERELGYGVAHTFWENGSPIYNNRYNDLKNLVSQNIPVLVLTWYDGSHTAGSGHFRVVKGYNDNLGSIIFHDPWYSGTLSGPDLSLNQSFFVDDLWTYSDRFGMIVCPWSVSMSKPTSVSNGQVFSVDAQIGYVGPAPLNGQYACANSSVTATIALNSSDYQLVSGGTNQRVAGITSTGTSGTSTWTVKSLKAQKTENISVKAEGLISGSSRSYDSYEDYIGGTAAGGGGPAVNPPATTRAWAHDSIGVTDPATEWYLAEGCTNGGFETWVLVQNPNDAEATVTLTYMTPNGQINGPTVKLPVNSRETFYVADSVPNNWSVSTQVTSDLPVIAERAMYGGGRAWAHDSIGVNAPAQNWYLAEGCTNAGFETWVLVQNPNDTPATVSLSYMTVDGKVNGPTATLKPNSRQTFYVADSVPNNWSVSTQVTSDQPVIAERSMYGGGRTWGHDSVGVSEPAAEWYLAEGCTNGGFETWVLVQNPNNSSTNVALTYMTEQGQVNGPTATLKPNSRQTFYVADSVPNNWSVSTQVTSDLPVIAERSMYGGGRTWGHDSVGVPAPANTWYLAEGCTFTGFETWVLVQNPNDEPVDVTLTFMTEGGEVPGPAATLNPKSRQTFNVGAYVSNTYEVSTMVDAPLPVIAERAMYGDRK